MMAIINYRVSYVRHACHILITPIILNSILFFKPFFNLNFYATLYRIEKQTTPFPFFTQLKFIKRNNNYKITWLNKYILNGVHYMQCDVANVTPKCIVYSWRHGSIITSLYMYVQLKYIVINIHTYIIIYVLPITFFIQPRHKQVWSPGVRLWILCSPKE